MVHMLHLASERWGFCQKNSSREPNPRPAPRWARGGGGGVMGPKLAGFLYCLFSWVLSSTAWLLFFLMLISPRPARWSKARSGGALRLAGGHFFAHGLSFVIGVDFEIQQCTSGHRLAIEIHARHPYLYQSPPSVILFGVKLLYRSTITSNTYFISKYTDKTFLALIYVHNKCN